jgi:hypothetical protein
MVKFKCFKNSLPTDTLRNKVHIPVTITPAIIKVSPISINIRPFSIRTYTQHRATTTIPTKSTLSMDWRKN